MTFKERRQSRGWTQEHLAQVSGLSVRTVQRLEGGDTPGADSLQALASAYGVEVQDLLPHDAPSEGDRLWDEHKRYIKAHLAIACITLAALAGLNAVDTPGQWWVAYVAAAWVVGLALHIVSVAILYRPARPDG